MDGLNFQGYSGKGISVVFRIIRREGLRRPRGFWILTGFWMDLGAY